MVLSCCKSIGCVDCSVADIQSSQDKSFRFCVSKHSAGSRLPEEVEKAGLFGNKMTALTAYLKGRLHGSYRTLKEYFRDVVGIDISTGLLLTN